ncbi:branched-chain amino acid ABC transporter substrate-binding protein [Chryseobacterium jejuense]|uniref:branched-chain amino acid ABC transporter substrate-binding protein n=1 Tax=Chryseobacterium jejuense TaxID=445960 RepID=UPI001AE3C8EA|nr:branched-chain amino acid ABC transporter substrate-binding protein [Chryseobacterium jejuense]MBP2615953.1 phosphate/sulfate permease [Chryseobacterium jejuense]
MSWNFLDILGTVADVVSVVGTSPVKDSDARTRKKDKQKDKYFTEKVSAGFILASAILFFVVFHKPLPSGDQTPALIVASLIGIAISALLFFVLNVMELYYFKSIFKLLLFSCSVIAFFISLVFYIYFKSGLFI